MRRSTALALAVLLALFTSPAGAGWDKTKPATNGALVSVDLRNNWTAVETALGSANQIGDPTFLVWAAGDAAAPTMWTLAGAGSSVARTGTGLGDTQRKVGAFAAKVTAGGGAVATLLQQLMTTTSFDDSFKATSVSFGAWVRCTVASAGRLEITDGTATSFSTFHTGGSSFEWLTISGHSVNAAATKLVAGVEVAISQTCHVSGPTLILGQIPPAGFVPAPVNRVEWTCQVAGNLATGTKCIIPTQRPSIVDSVELAVVTAPATQAVIVDVKTWDGAAYTSMYATRPQIAAAGTIGGAVPDTTYARRCTSGQFAGTAVAGSAISVQIDQVGTGTVGADLRVVVRGKQPARPFESFLAYNEVR